MPRHWLCARYRVPRDYAHPSAGTVSLAVAKLPAADRAERRGSVFFNPGGPGVSGLGVPGFFERSVGVSVHRVYDLVTWDPRGVGAPSGHSEPALDCPAPEEPNPPALVAPGASLIDHFVIDGLDLDTGVGPACARDPLTRFVTTLDNVRDLDRLRQAVRDPKLSYVGFSYGTVIGAVYANVFRNRYRALVLHGVVDSLTWFEPGFAFPIDDAVQLQKTLDAALQACDAAGPSVCALAPHAPAKYARLLVAVRAKAFASQDPESEEFAQFDGLQSDSSGLTQQGTSAIANARGLQAAYEELVVHHAASSPELTAAAQHVPPNPFDLAATRALPKDPHGAVHVATKCSDAGRMPQVPQMLDAWIEAAHQADGVAPVFGLNGSLERSQCVAWSGFGDRYTGSWNRGRAPLLLLNQQWDNATPLAWAQTMTRALGRTQLITISGWGHGVSTPCSTRAVDSYLLTGRPPSTSFCADGLGLFTIRGAPKLEVSASRRSLSSGQSTTLAVRVTNPREEGDENGVELRHLRTCLLLPVGLVSQRSRPRARLTHGSRCWRAAVLAAGHARTYTLTARALRGASGNLTALASTTATDATGAHARLTLSITRPPSFTG